uniref:Uncharacterized protein n=1 Tax=viral metagenome TaxID=1070528 RepID=A0A6C0D0V3_9ZZZZ
MIPIIVSKIDYNKWINSNVKSSNDKNIDILYLLYCKLCNIVQKYNDIELLNKYDLFNKFCHHFYDEYVFPYKPNNIIDNVDSDYIELFCENDIVDLFIHFKDHYNIFNYNNTSYPLVVFILNNSVIVDDYIESDDDMFYE